MLALFKMEWIGIIKMDNEQEIFDYEFNNIVHTHLLEVDYKAEKDATSFFERIRQTFSIKPPQFYIALPIIEIPLYDEDDNAL